VLDESCRLEIYIYGKEDLYWILDRVVPIGWRLEAKEGSWWEPKSLEPSF
jgi:hypothetical protein